MDRMNKVMLILNALELPAPTGWDFLWSVWFVLVICSPLLSLAWRNGTFCSSCG